MEIQLDKIGADVEWFLTDAKNNPIPCIGIVGGTKEKPLPLIPGYDGFTIQEDNVALEWGIPPAGTREEFIGHCMTARAAIDEKLEKQALFSSIVPSMRFTEAQLDHPQARMIGCEDDYNVWERKVNPKPKIEGDNKTLRSGGGHVHISFKVENDGKWVAPKFPRDLPLAEIVIMGCDLWLGGPSMLLDKDMERRKLYGKAGAFRLKPYGVEYRVLSNFWTKSPQLIKWVYDQIQELFTFLDSVGDNKEWFRQQKERVYMAINEGDQRQAERILITIGQSISSLPK